MSATSPPALDAVLAAAAAAAPTLAAATPRARAQLLIALADGLSDAGAELTAIAADETGLGEARLTGEVARTAVQLRLFAETVLTGGALGARIDEADPAFALGHRPDLRRSHRPVGPVLNFAASNFPFAFSVLGGDTASILAAGCPVIVKAHSGHPLLSDATGAVAQRVIAELGFPAGTLQVVHGHDAGVVALTDARVRAGSFTGSTAGGRALADLAAARPAPIPFFGELGSVNPVVVTAAAVAERAPELASGYLASVAGSAGQLCTKPGVLLTATPGPIAAALSRLPRVPEHRLLGARITESYRERRAALLTLPGVTPIIEGSIRIENDGTGWVTPTIVSASLATVLAHRQLLADETFGPLSVLAELPPAADPAAVLDELFEGSLTGTVHISATERAAPGPELARLAEVLAQRAGRVIFDEWPTGVAVSPAQQHGGPWPATTNDTSTSVGSAAISRFLRPVAFQNAPQALLPAELTDANPLGVRQERSRAGESLHWGAPRP
ncbi:aldehyde dehydrogenase family protein [Leucobacter luti]|uniref:NADP-dependent aldehyde dehydrogenase n=1 Tax=Leucobacter luti TaxID=340320 RepID=A0A4Q7TSY9_9MICO|nr:aldehyde dehydrogenase family protein [Leucobacter luti]MBL3699853.1 aldehyde dehydrogenase family protein [Leucobacter luti]RZT62828.1 NADP-dependent aldehyde dehydrogenase [Leucobacter luti]